MEPIVHSIKIKVTCTCGCIFTDELNYTIQCPFCENKIGIGGTIPDYIQLMPFERIDDDVQIQNEKED